MRSTSQTRVEASYHVATPAVNVTLETINITKEKTTKEKRESNAHANANAHAQGAAQ